MARDIRLNYIPESFQGDLVMDPSGSDILRDDGLETSVLISLFTNRRVLPDEAENPEDLRGWWADQISGIEEDAIGSKLWLLDRSKTTEQTLVKARQYAFEALEWMIDDGVAANVNVEVERNQNDRLYIKVQIKRIDGSNITFKYDDLWSGQFGGMNAL